MSLRFYFGPSGAGKSYQLYKEIIDRSQREPGKNFLVVVPDQFTMQTQKDLVTMHECEGIMNIDVLSFGRLSHRIFEEVGGGDIPVLDDTGKSLVLQKVAGRLTEELPALGGHLHKQGYIHEVKSAVSEFMQYGIGTEDVEKLIDFSKGRGALYYKLKDLEVLYRGFLDYIEGHFITTEETLDVLCRELPKSRIIAESVVAFDGFTGFTPIQYHAIREIMTLAQEVIMTVTLGEGENPYVPDGEQKLFHLSKKTVCDLERLAAEAGVQRGKDVTVNPAVSPRFGENAPLAHLERNLFRLGGKPYPGKQQFIRLFEASSPKEEVHQTGLQILSLIRESGMEYREIAVITGDLEGYAAFVETEFADMGIPCYIDRTRGIRLNPMVEYIKSALELYIKDFSYETVFHYLRSGLSDLTGAETDLLENYVLETGLRGRKKWQQEFTHKTSQMGEDEEKLAGINALRKRLIAQLAPLEACGGQTAADYVDSLYCFLVENHVQEKLYAFEQRFQEEGDLTRAKEYGQIYRLVMELLEQIHGLLGEEKITRREFLEILEAGFGEIEVGTLPQNVDRVLVGDMERTRLKPVKVLFFVGVNDGNIPKNSGGGGIISDMDREFLRESQLELAPSPRQQMYIQRFYLYQNMTKPSRELVLSYAKVGSDGRSLRPAYLVDTMKKLFPALSAEQPEKAPVLEQIVTWREGTGYLARALREYVEGSRDGLDAKEFFTLYTAYAKQPETAKQAELLREAAFYRYEESGLSRAVARALYGQNLENSVTRLETYAACAYRHFLQYGLTLREREEFGFEPVDMGNLFHSVLDDFARSLEESEYTWLDFPAEFSQQQVEKSLEQQAAVYGASVLYSSARNTYAITRMKRILTRTVQTLQAQLQRGDFIPEGHEISFHYTEDIESVNIALSEDERMRLQGRIDRVDVAEDDSHVYVKIIDYKSGDRQFDLAALYHGLSLQLVVYMNAAMELEAKKHPDKEIVPAALLYYHVEDPTVEEDGDIDPKKLNEELLRQLRTSGVVNGSEDCITRLDRMMTDKSDVIPVERKKDGSLSARSSVLTGQELMLVSRYVNGKIREIGREILEGHKELNPYEMGGAEACTYCPYKAVCGFDSSLPGCQKRVLEDYTKDEILQKMEEPD